MKAKVLFLMLLLFNFSFSQTNLKNRTKVNDQVFLGKLTPEEFEDFKTFIKTNSGAEINEETSYVINYKQPLADCFYNNYRSNECDHSWFEKNVYSKIALKKTTLKLYFQYENINDKKAKNCETKYDMNGYLYQKFFKKNELCFGLIIVNSKGDFRSYMGEYLDKDISKYLNLLNI